MLYCCFTAALLRLYCCFTAALLLLYCCFTAALLQVISLALRDTGVAVNDSALERILERFNAKLQARPPP
jgi:hypothetical protein